MRGEQSRLRVGGHQDQASFIQQTSEPLARGVPFEVFQQIAQGVGHDVADEHAHGVASGILHRREHLNAEVHVAELACGGHSTEGFGDLVQIVNVNDAG
jgi:hypothetical protein